MVKNSDDTFRPMILFSNVKESAFDTNNVNAKFER
jgi:hypothetical protein